jgi:hypothetical protein
MDPQRLKQAYEQLKETSERLTILDDKLSFRVRNRGGSSSRGNIDQMEDRLRDVAAYVLELRDIIEGLCTSVDGLFLGIASRPAAAAPPAPRAPETPIA